MTTTGISDPGIEDAVPKLEYRYCEEWPRLRGVPDRQRPAGVPLCKPGKTTETVSLKQCPICGGRVVWSSYEWWER